MNSTCMSGLKIVLASAFKVLRCGVQNGADSTIQASRGKML